MTQENKSTSLGLKPTFTQIANLFKWILTWGGSSWLNMLFLFFCLMIGSAFALFHYVPEAKYFIIQRIVEPEIATQHMNAVGRRVITDTGADGLSISRVDLEANTQRFIYFQYKDVNIVDKFSDVFRPMPSYNSQQLVETARIAAGDLVCRDIVEDPISGSKDRLLLAQGIVMACSISLPSGDSPYFKGILSAYFDKSVKDREQYEAINMHLRQAAKDLVS